MHVDAPRLTMMDLTTDHCGIGVRLYLKAGYTVPMDVTALKVALEMDREIRNYCVSHQNTLQPVSSNQERK